LCPCERREAKAKEKKGQTTNDFHEKLAFLKNPALAGRPEKQDQKTKGSNHQSIILRNHTHSARAQESIQWTVKPSFLLQGM
jgi:hypothetical protein